MDPIKVQMFGQFCLEHGGVQLSDSANRSKKVWCLLGYLICNRTRSISQNHLIDLLWGEEPDSSNPVNALRITLHRLRSTLDGLWPGAGKTLIVHKDGGYGWNPQVPVLLDCNLFEDLVCREYSDDEERLSKYLEALNMYHGEFLPKLSSELWTISLGARYHNLFLQVTLEAAEMLRQRGDYDQAAALCRKASASEPYHEPLHQLWMQVLGAKEDTKGAAKVYDALNKRLFDDFGIRPSEETRDIYRKCALSPEDRTLPIDEVLENLSEPSGQAGALVCDYDYFKILCFAEKRSMERNGNASHVALFSVSEAGSQAMEKKDLDRAMGQLERQMQVNLRRGDVVSRCSVSQLIVMLPNANYENSCMVCRRLLAAFHQTYPRVKIKVNFMVQPLTPNILVP